MRLHNFSNLIKKYSKGQVVAIFEVEGYYDQSQGGMYIEGEKIEEVLNPAAIVPISTKETDRLKLDEGGAFNHDYRKLYCYKYLKKGTIIKNIQRNGKERFYKILVNQDYSDFDYGDNDGLNIYYMERTDRDD